MPAALVVEQRPEHARGVEPGEQNQSIDPSVVTRAAVCRSPMSPWSAMAVSVMTRSFTTAARAFRRRH